ncbi:crossover junction endodeoxyribonuclease RuvC [Achromobacter ruhlandii]|uniref:crossover junction endodeoxyribonuclease RuvC n=1 Tax=Achromobacter ruhlandii TaxID=72557 RepID=UPI0021F1E80E|nr:crossover junction endodeoxyribonuclease RuvC [Achromobacter ruhlandii]MCV6799859.1 crossover junction endodeoxyribonuclease RuvC [Achromobacter ruhlandii]MCV6801431.1 crossover junction endodeoxyribonuclease RuvC [Achromobacter ruhlandii]MCV6812334.1 crossover junction endodeoxyribonuclease RuvC [Achromobacter ruhlandii]MCV6822447.1 crossover junction endodeoxyribonuclease RuvC [Achromobacter ruhlandii]
MTSSQNLTDAYDPMAGTLARTAMQCQARGCDGCLICRTAGPAQVVQERHKAAGGAGAAPDSFARAQGEIANFRNSESSAPAEAPALNVNILALDLGTKTGYALRRRDGAMRYGTVDFTPRKSWTPGQRWARFRGWLADTVATFQIDAVVYERVVFGHSSAASSDVYGGFKALVELAADTHSLTLSSVAVPTVKKHFTGSGRADKEAMLAQAKARGFSPDSHNAADALAILSWAVAQERKA